MKKTKTGFIVCLLLASMIVGVIPAVKASNQDSFGYTYTDSNTGGPAYDWIEINETGTHILPNSDNLWFGSTVVDLGFVFEFYGTEYDQLSVGSNGMLFFDNVVANWDNEPILSTPEVHGFVAPFWDSLVLGFNWIPETILSSVYSQTLGTAPNRVFVVEWQDMLNVYSLNSTIYNPISGVTFEALMYEGSNDIVFQYKDAYFGIPNLTYFDCNNGVSATVGIEDPAGIMGVEYSYNQPVIADGLAVLFSYPQVVSEPDLFVELYSPLAIEPGQMLSYSLSYGNLGGSLASDVTLHLNLSACLSSIDTYLVNPSDGGIFDPYTGIVTWDIGSIPGYPFFEYGLRTVDIVIKSDEIPGTIIHASADISTSIIETRMEDNFVSIQTLVSQSSLPLNVGLEGSWEDGSGNILVYYATPITFTYEDSQATSIDIRLQINDGGPDIVGTMTGPAPNWAYTITLYPRHGETTAIYTVHYPTTEATVAFNFYIDPAGYVYDVETFDRIEGATVWLQRPNGFGGWENVPVEASPYPIMQPDINPLVTGADGQYQWNTLSGTYRVHVEASGYYPTDSRIVTVPPPVTDLHVGLVKIPLPQDNSPPIVQPITAPLYPIQVNSPVSFSVTFTDSNPMDTHSAVWSWSDGYTSKGIITETNGEGTVTGTHIYTCAGVYTVTLTVSDSNGGSSEVSTQEYIVIYDPNAGFVTGGGWINSPAGAYPANPTLTGKANFGFVSKYQKGANVPSGNTEFDFRVAKFNFHGVSYDWLVIAGMKAQYKGSGTINGVGDYKFMLTAEDGGNQGQDTFRIKIWDATTDLVVYDNGAQSPLGGGSIIVHK